MSENGTLSTKQQRAIVTLLSARTIEEAATKAEISGRTLRRWMTKDEAFKTALVQAEGELLDTATRRLLTYADGALTVTAMLMADKATPPTVRLNAARTVLDYLLQLRGLRSVEQRLATLEAALLQQGKENADNTGTPPSDGA